MVGKTTSALEQSKSVLNHTTSRPEGRITSYIPLLHADHPSHVVSFIDAFILASVRALADVIGQKLIRKAISPRGHCSE